MSFDKVGLIYSLNDQVLEALCSALEKKCSGVAAAARELKSSGRLSSSLCNTLVKFDWTYNFLRHLTSQHAAQFYDDVFAAVSASHPGSIIDVVGSMTAKEDDTASVDTDYDIHRIYDATWTNFTDCVEEQHSGNGGRDLACRSDDDAVPNAVLTPRSGGPSSSKHRRLFRGRHRSAPVGPRHDSLRRTLKWTPKNSSAPDAEGDFQVQQLSEADDGAVWVCPCGFRNAASNLRCGGAGPLGCNRGRFLKVGGSVRQQRPPSPRGARESCRSRSPAKGAASVRHDTIINEAIEQLTTGGSRVHVHGIPGPAIRLALRSRPDLFIIEDRVNGRGHPAFNVRLTQIAKGVVDVQDHNSPRD